ncbi:hypothetical protein [Nannocystis pusilla]|uniref:hypothetical protein n=1 Tax=Nannocystis pusilla TaxID=889268 RepID=UPI003B7B32E5
MPREILDAAEQADADAPGTSATLQHLIREEVAQILVAASLEPGRKPHATRG